MKNEDKTNLVKIIYFDDESSVDYLNIKEGGAFAQCNEGEDIEEANTTLKSDVEMGAGFSLAKLFKIGANVNVNAGIIEYGKNIVKSTITNTILTDFIQKATSDSSIRKFKDFKIFPIENSMTYWKLYTPYTRLFREKFSDNISSEIDIKKLDELIDNVKGYYELMASDGKEKVIMRFNNSRFKNNYKLSNLLNMNLIYYGVNVGESTLEQYSVENEFNFLEKNITVDDIMGKSEEKDKIKIYDIFLAGVGVNE